MIGTCEDCQFSTCTKDGKKICEIEMSGEYRDLILIYGGRAECPGYKHE